jgi:hypothetical protein
MLIIQRMTRVGGFTRLHHLQYGSKMEPSIQRQLKAMRREHQMLKSQALQERRGGNKVLTLGRILPSKSARFPRKMKWNSG